MRNLVGSRVHSCWDTGGLKRAQKAENMFHLQEDEARSVSRAAKKDKEAASWVEKKRREERKPATVEIPTLPPPPPTPL